MYTTKTRKNGVILLLSVKEEWKSCVCVVCMYVCVCVCV